MARGSPRLTPEVMAEGARTWHYSNGPRTIVSREILVLWPEDAGGLDSAKEVEGAPLLLGARITAPEREA